MKKIFFLLIIQCFWNYSLAQERFYEIVGEVTDDKSQPLPFASISVLNTNKGTTANDKGEFILKLPEGDYQLVIQYLGFKKKIINVHLNQNINVNVALFPEEVTLKEVQIKATEDPAYEVIRNAIKKRKQHNKEINSISYQCDVYIKGVQKLNDVPEKIMGMEVKLNDNEKGIFYLSETQSTYYFVPPDKKKEIIKASRVSGQSKGFSFNRYIPMQKNIYENNLDFYFITNRPFISPISDNAFLFYKYKMQGTFFEDGKMINKIEVIPKSKTEPCFRGYIYIEENSWRVHSYDFYITKEAKLNFIDTLWLKQVNTKISDSLYFPVSIQYIFNFNVFGIKGNGYFIASISEYSFDKWDTLSKKFFKNEIVRFEKDAVKNDSVYWNAIRPIPLSEEEKKDYIKKDSIEKVTHSPRYLDSVDKEHNRFKFSNIVFGYNYRKTSKHLSWNIDGLLNAGIQYNTIEGVNLTLKTSLKKENTDETKNWEWQNSMRYGWANQLFGFKTSWKRADNPFNSRRYGINVQYYVEPFNHENSISEIVNTAYTLLDYRNYLKLYLKKSIDGFYHQEILNGLYITSNVSFEERSALKNTRTLDVFKKKNYFTSNNPLFPYNDSISFPTHQAMIFNIKIKYNIKQRYTTYPNMKYVWKNKYPVLYFEYTKALPFDNSMVDYDLIQGRIKGKIELNYFGDLKWEINGGKFLNARKMYFMDYKHFAGNQTIVLNDWNAFRILNYYNYSSNDYFVQAHSEYNLRGLLMGRIPFFKKFKLEEIVTIHYLHNNYLNHYVEWSAGVDKLFYVFRVEYAMAYYPFLNKPISMILVGLNFLNSRR
ncbi:MAG: membrane protein [Bacteroidia bacterium]|nr:MAG: membrane protein [Bacteroidia bacterium]